MKLLLYFVAALILSRNSRKNAKCEITRDKARAVMCFAASVEVHVLFHYLCIITVQFYFIFQFFLLLQESFFLITIQTIALIYATIQ